MDESSQSRSTNTVTPQSNRQLLDELDALMQRMLALPVEAREGDAPSSAAAPPPAIHRAAPASYTRDLSEPVAQAPPAGAKPALLVRQPTVAPAPVLQPPPLPESANARRLSPLVPMVVPRRLDKAAPRPAAVPAAPILAPAPAPEPLPPAKPIWLSPSVARPAEPPPRRGLFVRLLLAINWVYDIATLILGPLGSWLRSDAGRHFVGWCGILMLLGAAVWAAIVFLG
jgi:hypothetical protein